VRSDQLGRQFHLVRRSPQELFFPDTVLLGVDDITEHTRALVEERLRDTERSRSIEVTETERSLGEIAREMFGSVTFWAMVVAALIDSVNPCAIASLIFLLSFLTVQKKKRTDLLKIGLLFTATVFVTYLLLGLGFFKALAFLSGHLWIKEAIKWSAVVCAAIVGVISLIDAFRFKKSGNTKDVMLQLPKSVKLRIHKVITKNLTGKRLFFGTIAAGFLVTILDSICTAEVYLPVIVMVAQHTDGELKLIGWLYLIIYNIIFVMPLLAVIIAAYFGMTWNTLAKMTQKNLTLMKVLLGVVMLGLAVFLAVM